VVTQTATWGHKTKLRLGHWRVGLLAVLDITNRSLVKNDFLLAWDKKEWEVLLQGWRNWKHTSVNWRDPTQWFSALSLAAIYRRDQG